jgi:thiol-disulfide isomerase/thioredoxin
MRYLVFLLSFSFFSSCVEPNQTFHSIPPGIWRGVLLLDRTPIMKYGDDRDIVKKFDVESELPFNFEVIYDNDSTFHIVIHNDTERIKVTDIKFGRDKSTAKDTVIINFPIYDTYIKAIYEDGVMEGDWIVNYKENYRIPFKAVHGISDRFENLGTKEDKLSGKWESTFEIDTKDEYKAIGDFVQKGDIVTGTFLTETGDYRFLEGKLIKNKFYLSTFDGAHAFLFLGKIMDDGTLSGTFRSGSQYTTNWEAKRNDTFKLRNAYELTQSVQEKMDFAFLNTQGKTISLRDKKYENKYKIIQIMGTWCPNCMDETIFLKNYFKENQDTSFSLISIGFERYKDTTKCLTALKRFKDKMSIEHEVLYGGYYDKKMAALQIPQLDKIMSYPTLIFVDKSNKIRKIHTGFSGPATQSFQAYNSKFKELILKLKAN